MNCHLLLSADDRTGALEVGGLVADEQSTVPVGPAVDSERCCVVDIATRHLSPEAARTRMSSLLSREATHRAHKMDAGLRGNWPYEIEVLLDAGHKVAVVCSFPDAGRRCKDGVVYIHDLPVLESVFGKDPLNAPVSSRPADVLEHTGVKGDVVVWDADDNEEMHQAIRRARAENRVVVGASGALGAFAREIFPSSEPRRISMPTPRCVLCGSLNALSRTQIEQVGVPLQYVGARNVDARIDFSVEPTVLATPMPAGDITAKDAESTALQAAAAVREVWSEIGTLIVVGGDTAAALVGDDTLDAMGMVAPGIPASMYQGVCLITKGGGIGQPGTIEELLKRSP
jgi:uncharacterized protein YgbK (DUF1537 family)